MLCVCLSVCNVGVLSLNGVMDQDATSYGSRPRPRRHCARWGPSSPTKRGIAAFLPVSITAKRSPISATAQLLYTRFLWSPNGIGEDHYIFILSFVLLLLLFCFPRLISAVAEWMSAILAHLHTWCGLSANLRWGSETCCTRLAANTGRKKVVKNHHLGTIAQLCRAISSQLRHVSTIGKKLVKQRYLLYMSW